MDFHPGFAAKAAGLPNFGLPNFGLPNFGRLNFGALNRGPLLLGALLGAALTPAPAAAQIFLTHVDFRSGPVEASDPLVGGPLPGATPSEYRANLLWNFRAGLNVAALQCQFSPYLRVAANYNGLLVHHSKELAAAVIALNGYFKRVGGPVKGQKMFDDYSTIVYNGFSTLSGQMGFCQTASNIMKTALVTPKGELAGLALKRMRELRNSLIAASDPSPPYNPYTVRLDGVPPLREECWGANDRLKPSCLSLTSSLQPQGIDQSAPPPQRNGPPGEGRPSGGATAS